MAGMYSVCMCMVCVYGVCGYVYRSVCCVCVGVCMRVVYMHMWVGCYCTGTHTIYTISTTYIHYLYRDVCRSGRITVVQCD